MYPKCFFCFLAVTVAVWKSAKLLYDTRQVPTKMASRADAAARSSRVYRKSAASSSLGWQHPFLKKKQQGFPEMS